MPSPVHHSSSRGYVIPIGGAEDKVSDRVILSRFVAIAGGAESRISVIPTASQLPDTGARYREIFTALGCRDVRVLPFEERVHTENPHYLEALNTSTGVFMTGGNQLRLSTILGGTPVATQIRRLNARGVAVAGTSAGAAFVSEHMIAFGSEGSTPIAGMVNLAPGLGLTNRVIVDQHFTVRDRLGRLMAALAYNPFAIGIGLDEDTGAFISGENTIEVVGTGGVTIVDVSDLQFSGMAEAVAGDPVQLVGVRLHVLTHGATFDLDSRVASPSTQRPPKSSSRAPVTMI